MSTKGEDGEDARKRKMTDSNPNCAEPPLKKSKPGTKMHL